ncbi:MAG: glycosyltransferase family 2 protein [Gammaproteobacteria bacterium]|jgi:glycosyltransferase involved in cell wall biosynthesis|nr:glycosyltransferase family 2 protein [Gammaproteobacteria bacterium]
MNENIEVSFVMPCLNEAETLEGCIQAAQRCITDNSLKAEVIVADNGSDDGSQEIARQAGALVVDAPEPGYGAALMGGFDAAHGKYLIMGDSDQSYDFNEAIKMIRTLREGADLVMGSRFKGRIMPGAMPWKHRWIGNPILSFIGRLLFRTPISDFHCGLRGIRRQAYKNLGLRTTGMEFASEMVVKAAVRGLTIREVPITLHPDKRTRPPHLRSWRDGWRHLRFMMTLSPRWTLGIPGLLLLLPSALLLARLANGPLVVGTVTLDIHTMQIAALMVLTGFQAITIAMAARIYAVTEEIGPAAPWMNKLFNTFTLEHGLILGILLIIAGVLIISGPGWNWVTGGFGPLVPAVSMRPVIVGVTLFSLGVQTLAMSFLYSMLGIARRRGE